MFTILVDALLLEIDKKHLTSNNSPFVLHVSNKSHFPCLPNRFPIDRTENDKNRLYDLYICHCVPRAIDLSYPYLFPSYLSLIKSSFTPCVFLNTLRSLHFWYPVSIYLFFISTMFSTISSRYFFSQHVRQNISTALTLNVFPSMSVIYPFSYIHF